MGRLPAAASGGDRAGQRGVEQQRPDLGQGGVQWFRHRSISRRTVRADRRRSSSGTRPHRGSARGTGAGAMSRPGSSGTVWFGQSAVASAGVPAPEPPPRRRRRRRGLDASPSDPAAAGSAGRRSAVGGDHRGRPRPATTSPARRRRRRRGVRVPSSAASARAASATAGVPASERSRRPSPRPRRSPRPSPRPRRGSHRVGGPDRRCRPGGSGRRPGPLRPRRTARPGCARRWAACR